MSKGHEVFQQQLYIGLLYINNCQYLHRIFEMEMTGKATPHFVKRPWSVSVATLYTIVVYHQLSRSSSIFWNADDMKSDTSNCQDGMKRFSKCFKYDCCISPIVRIFKDYLKWRWQEKRHLNMSKRREVFQWQLYIRLLYIINCQDLHGLFEMEMTGEATPQYVKAAWSVSVTALYTIVVCYQLSRSSANIWNVDDSRSDTSIFRKGMKCFSNNFI